MRAASNQYVRRKPQEYRATLYIMFLHYAHLAPSTLSSRSIKKIDHVWLSSELRCLYPVVDLV